jgi:hypothetical protein
MSMAEERTITRRDFIRGTAGIALAASFAPGIWKEAAQAAETSKVILIRHPEAVSAEGKIRREIVQSMVDEALQTLLSEKEPLPAWKRLFNSSDVVGIKSNHWRDLPTPKELESAIRQRLMDAGVSEKNIGIDDRGVRNNPIFLSSTALVNVRPVRTHHWAGIGSCIKNYIQFVPRPSEYHDDACADLARIWDLPVVKGKTRLNILCALQPQFYGRGASFFDRRYVWPYRGLLLGADPVAVDAVGAHLLQRKRIAFFGEDRELDVPPTHINVADQKYHLGVSDLKRIQLVKLGWQDDVLI